MVCCVVYLFLPEVVDISVEIAVNCFVVLCARFTVLFFHGQFSLSVFILDCDHGIPHVHLVMCKAVLSRNKTSGLEWFKCSRTWCVWDGCSFCLLVEGFCHRHVFGHPLTHQNRIFTG